MFDTTKALDRKQGKLILF